MKSDTLELRCARSLGSTAEMQRDVDHRRQEAEAGEGVDDPVVADVDANGDAPVHRDVETTTDIEPESIFHVRAV